MSEALDYLKPEYYDNRELSWLKFDYRILSEARDKTNPLFERLKFLSITASNLDEFFMVRVASLKDMVHAGYEKEDIAGMTPKKQLLAINEDTHALVNLQYSTYNRSLVPLLKQQGVQMIAHHEGLNKKQAAFVDKYFEDNVYPVLTPMAVDSSRPFPLIRNKSLNLGALVKKKPDKSEKTKGEKGKEEKGKDDKNREVEFATVQVPSVLPRVVEIPDDKERVFIFLEEIIERNIEKLFLNYDVLCIPSVL